jgi:hypothetical protein
MTMVVLVAPDIFKEDAAAYGSKADKKKAKEREEKLWGEVQKLKARNRRNKIKQDF